MKIKLKISNWLSKLRNLPETEKKFIIFSAVVFFAVILIALNVISTKNGLEKISRGLENFHPPKFNFEMTDFSKEFSDINSIISKDILLNVSGSNEDIFKQQNGQFIEDENLNSEIPVKNGSEFLFEEK